MVKPRCKKGKTCGKTCIAKKRKCCITKKRTKQTKIKTKSKRERKGSSNHNCTSLGAVLGCSNMSAKQQKAYFKRKAPSGYMNAIFREDGLCTPGIIKR